MGVTDKVRLLVEPLLADEGLTLFDIEYGGGRLVVLADREGGVDLEALTRATHRISAALDEHDPIPGGRYLLEVSSPGLERRLRTPEHYRRYVGSLVSIKTLATVQGDRRIRGILSAADATGVTVEDRTIPYTDIERAQTVFEWGPAPKPGKPDTKKTPRRPRDADGGSAPSSSTDPSDPRDQKAPAS
ncbi:MAG: ribosome maturation factor RimP [Acidimicrobiales bacterium]